MGQGWQDISSPTTGVEPNAFDYNDSILRQETLVRSTIHGQVLTVELLLRQTYLKVYVIPDWEEQSKNNRKDHLDVRPGGETKNTENQELNKLKIESW